MVFAGAATAENWPQWRGPFANGSTDEKGLPESWSKTENVAWKTALPGPGASTPVIWEDRVFLSAGEKSSKDLLAICVDAKTGKILWSKKTGKDRKMPANRHNAASPSACTDGKSVFFFYGTGDIVAYDFEGKELWKRPLEKEYGNFVIKWGYGASPLLYRGKLYIPVLQNKKPGRYGRSDSRRGQLDSFALALDAATGKTAWKQARATDAEDESTESYGSIISYEGNDKPEVVLLGGEFATGHDAETGKELWRWEFVPSDREVWQRMVSTGTVDGKTIYFGRPRGRCLYALRPLGGGKLPEKALAWKQLNDKANDVTGPLVYEGRLYILCGKTKTLSCLDPVTGKVIWSQSLGTKAQFRASPTGTDGKIYTISMNGEVVVVKAGDAFKKLASIEMGEKTCLSTISVSSSRLFVRTPRYLYCISAAK
jgi:outer membrane protein assembly factor BamB